MQNYEIKKYGEVFHVCKGFSDFFFFFWGYGEWFLWILLDLSSYFVEVLVSISFEGHDEPVLLGFIFFFLLRLFLLAVSRGGLSCWNACDSSRQELRGRNVQEQVGVLIETICLK